MAKCNFTTNSNIVNKSNIERGVKMLDIDVEVESENLCNMITQMINTNKKLKKNDADDFSFKAVQRCMKLRHEIYR